MNIVDQVIDRYKEEYNKNPIFLSLLTILFVFFMIFVILAVITGGDTVYNSLDSARNTFSDHFNSIMYSIDDPYTNRHVIYPPLVTTLYAALGHFLIPFTRISAGTTISDAIKDSQLGIMSFFVLMFLAFYILYLIFSRLTKDLRKDTSMLGYLLFLLIVSSAPFLYGFERGNNIFFTVIFCFIFLMGYRSENKWIRYLSYISLGFAAGFKLYPAIFALLILRDREYKEFLICTVIVSVLIFVPFIFTDGTPLILFDNIISHAGDLGKAGGFINLQQLTFVLFHDLLSHSAINMVSIMMILLVTALSVIVVLFDREMKFWKVVAIIACNLVIGPGVGAQYIFIYMIIPLLFFLISEKDMNSMNKIYVVSFAIILILIPGGLFLDMVSIRSIFVMLILISLLREGFQRIYQKHCKKCLDDEHIGISN